MPSYFIGVDVQVRRKCSYAVIDTEGTLIDSGWFTDPGPEFLEIIGKYNISGRMEVGIDAPRMPLLEKRRWYWDGRRRRWKLSRSQNGYGRHCEIVISAHRIANPQWTPLMDEAPEWMRLGFSLFTAVEKVAGVHEVFPAASYCLLSGIRDVKVRVDFSACKPGPKDMLDAWVAAATVKEFVEKRGCEVGGGDGLGTIVLPRPLPPERIIDEVLAWPSN